MEVFIASRPDNLGKFQGVAGAFSNIWSGRILDIGARSGQMKEAIRAVSNSKNALYCSVDLFPPSNVIANLEKGLPFADESFDVVVVMDVLEHTNNIHFSFSEVCRVSKKFICITLPNIYELKHRIKFIKGSSLSGKYGLPIVPPRDRHRWFFSFREAENFIHEISKVHSFTVKREGILVGPSRKRLKLLLKLYPGLFAPTYLVLLERI